MSVIDLEFYDGDDPNGALLGTLTDAECSAISLRVALRGVGAGSFSISRSHPSADANLIRKGNYVRVVIPSIQAEAVWGFWLWEGKFNLLDAQGDDTLTFSGPGPLGILRDAILHEDCFAPSPPASAVRGILNKEGYWFWSGQAYGAIVTRIIEEGQNQPGEPLAPVSITFNRDVDSDAIAWPNIDLEYQQPIQANTLKVFEDLRDAGDLFVVSSPAFVVGAFQTFGTDRTSATFAAGKVRLTDTNILTGLPVHIHATNELTHLLSRDLDGAYSSEVAPGFAGRARWGALDVPETNDPPLLTKIGQETLAASTLNTNAFELEVTPGDDEAIGRYLPWLHYNVGDTVTVDAESGLFAYVDEDAKIVAFRVELDEASDDATDDTAHRSLHTVLEFNAATSEGGPIENRPTVVGAPGCRCLELCRPTMWTNVVCGSLRANILDSGEFSPHVMERAADCDDATGWGSNGAPVSNQHWGVDLLSVQTIASWRILHTTFAANSATAVTVYATSDDAKWAAVAGAPYDFAAAGWTAVASLSGLTTGDNTGSFAAASFRYWVFDATAGGGNGWSVNEFGLNTLSSVGDGHPDLIGTSVRAKRCDDTEHYHTTADPTVNDDTTLGFRNGTMWINETSGAMFLLLNNAEGAADWLAVGGTGVDLSGINFLVGTASGDLSAEIVVGATPGGELGNTWASPTVDATHSGSSHAATQAAAEATADSALTAHEGTPHGSDPADDTQVWMPLTTVVGGVPELVWDANNSLIPTLVPLE